MQDGKQLLAQTTAANFIEYGHLSALNGYATPNYVDLCNNAKGCSWADCVEKHTVNLETKHVKCGDLIGYSGNTGNCISTIGGQGYHLHVQFK